MCQKLGPRPPQQLIDSIDPNPQIQEVQEALQGYFNTLNEMAAEFQASLHDSSAPVDYDKIQLLGLETVNLIPRIEYAPYTLTAIGAVLNVEQLLIDIQCSGPTFSLVQTIRNKLLDTTLPGTEFFRSLKVAIRELNMHEKPYTISIKAMWSDLLERQLLQAEMREEKNNLQKKKPLNPQFTEDLFRPLSIESQQVDTLPAPLVS